MSEIPSYYHSEEISQIDQLLNLNAEKTPEPKTGEDDLDQQVFVALARLVQSHKEEINKFLNDFERKKLAYRIPDIPKSLAESVFNLEIDHEKNVSLLIEPTKISRYQKHFKDQEFTRLSETFSYNFVGRRDNYQIIRNGFDKDHETPSGEQYKADKLDKEIIIKVIDLISQQEKLEEKIS